MAIRSFGARSNDSLTITSDSPNGTAGTGIINNSSTPIGTIFQFNAGFPNLTISLDDTSTDMDTFNDDDEGNHVITDGQGIVANGAEVESESIHFLVELDANGNQIGPTISVTVFSQGGDFEAVWGLSTNIPLRPGARYVKTGGTNDGDSSYLSFVPCFAAGTLIRTPEGNRPIETLKEGDLVITKDNGARPIRLVAMRDIEFSSENEHLKPIEIKAGRLGKGLPSRTLVVSPQHRMLLVSASGEEVLGLAKGLTKLPGIRLKHGCKQVTYIHLLFDRHEIIFADDAPTESFRPGPVALGSMEAAVQSELLEIFPDLRTDPDTALGEPARPLLRLREVRELVAGNTGSRQGRPTKKKSRAPKHLRERVA